MKLNETNKQKFLRNLKMFTIPVGVLYIGLITSRLAIDGHVISWSDFNPGLGFINGLVLYILNAGLDYLLKIKGQSQ